MQLNKENVVLLIQEYEKRRLLWDPRDKWHFNRQKKDDAWREIGESLGIDAEDAKKKMSSLLGSFRREKSKGKKFVDTGNGVSEVYKSDWFAFKYFAFLLDRYELREAYKSEQIQENASNQYQSNLVITESNQESSISFASQIAAIQSDDSDSNENDIAKLFAKPFISRKKKLKKLINKNAKEDSGIEMADRYMPQPQEDSTIKYTKYLAEKLNQFNPRTKAILIHKINTLLFEAEMCMYSNPSPTFETPSTSTSVASSQTPPTDSQLLSPFTPCSSTSTPPHTTHFLKIESPDPA